MTEAVGAVGAASSNFLFPTEPDEIIITLKIRIVHTGIEEVRGLDHGETSVPAGGDAHVHAKADRSLAAK